MDISSVSSSLLQQISNTSTQNGDAVTIKVMRKALDIQAQQANALIQSVVQSAPKSEASGGRTLDVYA